MEGKVILKWIAVPFAAVLCSFIGGAIFKLSQWIFYGYILPSENPDAPITSITHILVYLLGEFAIGAGFVYGGVLVAPSAKKIVNIVLATIEVMFCIIAALMSHFITADLTFLSGLALIACAAGSIFYAYYYNQEPTP